MNTNIVLKQREFFNSDVTLNLDFREQQLKKLLSIVIKEESDIQEALYEDLGKCKFEGYLSEIGFMISDIKYALSNFRKFTKPKKGKASIVNQPGKTVLYQQPYGVVLNISPWNYPFQLSLAPVVGAMAAGNTIILKPSEFSPATAKLLQRIVSENFDENYFSVCLGEAELTKELIKQAPDYIFFTGGSEIGKHIMRGASDNLIPVTLELGGKSPCVVLDDVDVDIAAKRIVWGKYINCGQTCVAPDFLYVSHTIKEELVEKLKFYIKEFYGSNPIESKDYGKIVHKRHFDRLLSLIEVKHEVYGGKHILESLKIEPTLLESVHWDDKVMKEEIFGPILPIITFTDEAEALEKLKKMQRPLAFYVFSNNIARANKFLETLPFGGGCLNETIVHLAEHDLPFGGIGSSGMGSYHGKHSFDTFSHEKSILKKSTWIDIPLRYPPFTLWKMKWAKKFIG